MPEEVTIARAVRSAFKVKRYHTEECIHEETVGEHTAGVVALCMILCDGEYRGGLIANAIFHDFPEKWTGDIPYPVKRDNPDIKPGVTKQEEKLYEKYHINLPILTGEDTTILKAADMLQLCYKAKGEIMMGNRLFLGVLENGLLALGALHLQGAVGDRLRSLVGDVSKEWEV